MYSTLYESYSSLGVLYLLVHMYTCTVRFGVSRKVIYNAVLCVSLPLFSVYISSRCVNSKSALLGEI